MARWKLTADHQLLVAGSTYKFKEALVGGGEEGEQSVPCARLLEINNPRDQNTRDEYGVGIITVAHAGSKQGRDYVFEGPPTPDMIPLDAEAEGITNSLRPEWDKAHGPQAIGSEDYTKALMDKLMSQPAPAPESDKMLELLAGQNAILAKLADAVGPRRL